VSGAFVHWRRFCAALVLVGVLGCNGGGLGGEELAQPPIAVLYWDRQATRDLMEAAEGRRGSGRRGVARLDDLGRLLGAADPDVEALVNRFPGRLSLVDPATGAVRPIAAVPPGALPLSWSSDRSRLLVAASRGLGNTQLYEYRPADQELRPVTTGPLEHSRGSYGPPGGIAVVAELGDGRNRVSLSGVDGAPPRTLFEGPLIGDVRWSPRGDMLLLAVIGPARRARMLFTVSADAPAQGWPPGEGSRLESLGRGRDPVFSIDGEWIVYSAAVGSGWRLRRMRAAGGGRLPIGRGVRDELEPALSPDGRLVAFVSEEGGLNRLFIRRVDGSGNRLLVPDGVVARPAW